MTRTDHAGHRQDDTQVSRFSHPRQEGFKAAVRRRVSTGSDGQRTEQGLPSEGAGRAPVSARSKTACGAEEARVSASPHTAVCHTPADTNTGWQRPNGVGELQGDPFWGLGRADSLSAMAGTSSEVRGGEGSCSRQKQQRRVSHCREGWLLARGARKPALQTQASSGQKLHGKRSTHRPSSAFVARECSYRES